MDFNKNLSSNLFSIAEDYIKLITSITGMKGIIFDPESKIIFSLITSKSFAIKEEIFMFEELKNIKKEEKYLNIKGIFFLRPNEANIDSLIKILKDPNFTDIHLFFTNTVKDEYLRKLAVSDEYAAIKSIQEVFIDFFIATTKLLHFDIDSTFMIKSHHSWSGFENAVVERIIDGIFSACMSLRLNPVIKSI